MKALRFVGKWTLCAMGAAYLAWFGWSIIPMIAADVIGRLTGEDSYEQREPRLNPGDG